MTKVITFSNQKGGVAKTTSTIMTAGCLTSRGKKVLIVDADPQCNSSNFAVSNFDEIKETHPSLFEMIFDENLDVRSSIIAGTDFGDIIIASRKLWDMDRADTDPLVLREIIDEVRNEYDYVVVDTPPHLGWLQLAALYASDYVVIPTDADNLSAQNIPYLENTIKNVQKKNTGLKIAGVLFTRIESRGKGLKVEKQLISDLNEYTDVDGIHVFKGYIRAAKPIIGEASLTHKNIFKQRRIHKVKQDYSSFVDQLLEVVE